MSYWELPPPPRLRDLVARFSGSVDWTPPARPIRVLPDGSVDLLFSFGAAGCRAEVIGAKSRALLVHDCEPLEKIAVHLRPGAFGRLFRISAWELRDRAAPLEALWPRVGSQLLRRLRDADDWDARRAILESELARTCDPTGPGGSAALVDRAVARLTRSGGTAPVGWIAAGLGVNVRTLERAFREHVGVGPKLFARILRFRRARRALQNGGRAAEVAAHAGFADQPHMVREFRVLAGVSPSRLGP